MSRGPRSVQAANAKKKTLASIYLIELQLGLSSKWGAGAFTGGSPAGHAGGCTRPTLDVDVYVRTYVYYVR